MKELTFREVIANIKEGEVWENKDLRISKIFINESGAIHFQGDMSFSMLNSTCVNANDLYKLQRKEYTFQEALDSGKKVRCESELIDTDLEDDEKNDEHITQLAIDKYSDGEFITMVDMLSVLGYLVAPKDIKKVINKGKWYIGD